MSCCFRPVEGLTYLAYQALEVSVVDPNTLNLDPDPGFRPYLDPGFRPYLDTGFWPNLDPVPGLCHRF